MFAKPERLIGTHLWIHVKHFIKISRMIECDFARCSYTAQRLLQRHRIPAHSLHTRLIDRFHIIRGHDQNARRQMSQSFENVLCFARMQCRIQRLIHVRQYFGQFQHFAVRLQRIVGTFRAFTVFVGSHVAAQIMKALNSHLNARINRINFGCFELPRSRILLLHLQMEHQQARVGQIVEFQCQIGEDFDGAVFDNHRRTHIATRRQAHTVRDWFSQIVREFGDAIREPFLRNAEII